MYILRKDEYIVVMGINLRQRVSNMVYNEFNKGSREELVVQDNDYFSHRLNGVKYIWLVNDEVPEKPEIRYKIEYITKEYGRAQEDIYGQFLTDSYLKIKLKKREKT